MVELFTENFFQVLKKCRRDLHEIPEIGFKEFKTQKYIIDFLEELGYFPEVLCGTGVSLFLNNNKKETVAFRADIDALPIEEETSVEFASKHRGYMHACGHDGHATILLGLAKLLKESFNNNLKFNILLIFQPAEESPGGAVHVVKSGIFEKYNVKKIFGLHLSPKLEEGFLGCCQDGFMAKASEINVDFFGKSGHCGQPQNSVDSIQGAIKFLDGVNNIVVKRVSPFDPSLISFNKILGGTVRNIVAEHTRLEGTIRSFSQESFDFILENLENLGKSIELGYNLKFSMEADSGYPPVVNDPTLYHLLKDSISDSKTIKFQELQPEMLAEDFSFYQEKIPGLFFFLGTKNSKKGFDKALHNSSFNFDEKILLLGIETYISILKKLEQEF